jgi:DNA-binding response OmpR family regulator
MEELIARVENQLRLAAKEPQTQHHEDEILLGNCTFYPGRYELQAGLSIIKLSHRESQVLGLLCRHRNQTIERKRLLQLVWGDDSFFNSRNLDVYIRKLREHFAGDPRVEIITLKSVGYFFRAE